MNHSPIAQWLFGLRERVRRMLRLPVIWMVLTTLVFAAGAVARLNQLHFYDPDSADYVIQANSLATGRGYVHLELPGRPPQTLRPPGLSLLLVPSQWMSAYDTVAAKITMIAVGGLLLWLTFALAARGGHAWSALVVTTIVATSPYTLFFSTEVLSEAPFTLATLGLIFIIDNSRDDLRGWRLWLAVALLSFLPLLRSVGMMMILAVGAWALVSRRWPWLVPVTVAGIAQVCWSQFSRTSGSVSYFSSLGDEISGVGLAGMVARALQGLLYYSENLLEHLLPIGSVGNPYYWLVMIADTKAFGIPRILAATLAVAILVNSLMGFVRRQSPVRAVGLAYLVLYMACISVWPFRQERFVWPLIPILFVGLSWRLADLITRLQSTRTLFWTKWGCGLLAILLVFAQCFVDARIIAANLKFLADRDAFYEEEFPPSYYRDWPAAGRWLAANSDPEDRVLTHRATLACTAHRFQRLVRFEGIAPQEFHTKLTQFGARWIVIAGTQSPELFPWHLLDEDPVYCYEVAYERGDVAVLSVRPNRTGTIHKQAIRPFDQWVPAMRRAVEHHPDRPDLRVALAQALQASERHEDAVSVLSPLVDSGLRQPGPYLLTGYSLRVLGRHAQALSYLRQGELLADLGVGRRGFLEEISRAQRSLENQVDSDQAELSVDIRMATARFHAMRFEYCRAWKAIMDIPPQTDVHYLLRAEIQLRLGDKAQAERDYVSANELGSSEASAALRLFELERRIAMANAMETRPNVVEIVELAQGYIHQGVPGKALALLEQFATHHSDSVQYLRELAGVQRFYAQWTSAEETLRKAQALTPDNPTVAEELAILQRFRSQATF